MSSIAVVEENVDKENVALEENVDEENVELEENVDRENAALEENVDYQENVALEENVDDRRECSISSPPPCYQGEGCAIKTSVVSRCINSLIKATPPTSSLPIGRARRRAM